MSFFQTATNSLSATGAVIKTFFFGENNSRLDILLDRFYGLRQEQRTKIILYTFSSLVFFFAFILYFYFFGLYSLQQKLNVSTEAISQLQNVRANYAATQEQFLQIVSQLQSVNQPTSVITAISQKAKEMDLQISGLPDKAVLVDLPVPSPVGSQFQKARIEFKISSISLKKIIDFVNEIQQLENKFNITMIDIQQIFGTKLYFDVGFIVESYVPSKKYQDQ